MAAPTLALRLLLASSAHAAPPAQSSCAFQPARRQTDLVCAIAEIRHNAFRAHPKKRALSTTRALIAKITTERQASFLKLLHALVQARQSPPATPPPLRRQANQRRSCALPAPSLLCRAGSLHLFAGLDERARKCMQFQCCRRRRFELMRFALCRQEHSP